MLHQLVMADSLVKVASDNKFLMFERSCLREQDFATSIQYDIVRERL